MKCSRARSGGRRGGRNEHSFEERVRMDVHYIRNWSVWLDLIILARTVRCVLLGRGAY
nr:sugar transferase [Rubrobacter xylanophilus]